jgi:hypothetical protein
MKRSPVTWILSIALGCLMLLAVVTTGAAQVPLTHLKSVVGLPQVEASQEDALVVARPDDPKADQDFVYTGPEALAQAVPNYQPREEVALADPTNYGERFAVDAFGNPILNDFIVVLHETVGSARSAINTFQTPHPRDQDQVSYHTLIARDGTVVYIVPPEYRAFGAGNSVFNGPNGMESVVTNHAFPPSVNNFAYHVSLETPSDGRHNRGRHSGYTEAQYRSLAWLLARTNIPDSRITTHRSVDRSNSRQDPRSFNFDHFFGLLHQYPSRQAF